MDFDFDWDSLRSLPKYPKHTDGDLVELQRTKDVRFPVGSGICPSHLQCPECNTEYWGAPRNPKTLVYVCAECSQYFDIEGEVFPDCVCRTGLMYVTRRTCQ